MNLAPLLLRLLVCGTIVGIVPTQAATVTLRVLTYNIHHGQGTDGRLDLERIARVIQERRADLVALQEVDRKVPRSGMVDQVAELERLTGLKAAYGKNLDLQGGEYGNAILSRFPILEHRNHALPRLNGNEQRGLLEVLVSVENRRIAFFCTHLNEKPADRERLLAVEAIQSILKNRANLPVLLAGDLNACPDSEVLRRTMVFLKDTCTIRPADALTIPAGKPDRRIDYVLHNGHAGIKTIESHVISEKVASDHRPVITVIELVE